MGKKKFIILFLIIAFLCQFTFAELPEAQENGEKEQETPFFKSVLQDEGEIWTSPFRMKKAKTFITWGSVALITAVLIKNDESLYRRTKEYQEKNEWVDWLSPKFTILGDGNLNLGVAGAFYLSGLLFKDKKARKTGELVLMSLIHATVVVQLGKHLCGRQRPEAENGVDRWAGPSGFFKRYVDHRDMLYDAMPSGHTITAWSMATVVAHMYNEKPFVPILCYSLATLSGLSRVTEDKHWYSDVFLGAVLGFAIGKFVVKKRWSRLNVTPFVGQNQVGLGLNIQLN